MIKKLFQPIYLLGILVCLFSCKEDNKKIGQEAKIAPSMSCDIIPYGRLLYELPHDGLLEGFALLKEQYPAFSNLYTQQIINARSKDRLIQELQLMKEDSSFIQLFQEVDQHMGDLSDIKSQIDQTLENYLKVFGISDDQLPILFTFISGFSYQAFIFDDGRKNGIGIGLDMFLGDDFPYQKIRPTDPAFSKYLTRTYNKEHLVRKMAEVLVEDRLAPPRESNFLSLMIWGGKKLYLIDKLLNFAPDTIVTEYTSDQLQWCQNNESEIWQFFFDHDLFYEQDIRKFNKLISPAPNSPGMPPEAPGQTANYIGWQIIRAYMTRYPNTSVLALVNMESGQQLLNDSRYKPPR